MTLAYVDAITSVALLGLTAPAVLALTNTLVNAASWSRGTANLALAERVSVCVPARNEAANIVRCVRAIQSSEHPIAEIIVCDDGSTDGTAELLGKLASEVPSLRVIQGEALPTGWIGKVHACHLLAAAATGSVLVFVDADTALAPTGLAHLLSELANGADLVTAVPQQRTVSFAEKQLLPLLHLTYTSWLPLALIHRTRSPLIVAANGQLMAIRRTALDAIGGFSAIHNEIVDDMALCRAAKTAGLTVRFADGHEMATTRMYADFTAIWRGFSKNIYEGLGARTAALFAATSLYLTAFVAPYLVLAGGLIAGSAAVVSVGLVGVACNVALRATLAARYRHAWHAVISHPIAVLVLVAIALNSWRWERRGAIEWAGRSYLPRALRRRASHTNEPAAHAHHG